MKKDIDQNQNLNGIQKDLRQIQENTIRYFNKDYQTFLFLRFNDPKKSRNWISQLVPEITTTQDVQAFNDLFNIVKHHSSREELAKASCINITFTHSGLKALGVIDLELELLPDDFKDGFATRAKLVRELGASVPENWIEPLLESKDIHALFIVAADSLENLDNLVDGYIESHTFAAVATIIFRIETGYV